MCLGEVAQVVEVRRDGWAIADTANRQVSVSLVTLGDPVAVGDWIVMHAGFALARLSAAEAHDALALRAGGSGPFDTPTSAAAAVTAAARTPWEGSA